MPITKRQTHAELTALQRLAGAAIMRRLDKSGRTQRTWVDGRRTADVAGGFVKPNDRLTSLERIEIYNRQYWFRLIDALFEDFPGLLAVLGQRKFDKVVEAYIDRYPSRSFSLRNLGSRMERFLTESPELTAPRTDLAIEMARFEWAQVVAFDGPARPAVTVDELLGANPAKLRLGVQPYVTLLELNWPLDDWSIAVKQANRALRSEASNAVETDEVAVARVRHKPPKREKVFVAVHRHDNAIYYKRLEADAYRMLTALRDGQTLNDACATVPGGRAADVQRWFASWTAMGWFCKRERDRRPGG